MVLQTPPAVSTMWLNTIERACQFTFKVLKPPSEVLDAEQRSDPAGAAKKSSRGGNRAHRLKCPVHGTESLGSWLRTRGQLGDVRTYFAQVGIYEDLIETHKLTIFQGKPVVVNDVDTIRLLTTAVVKVCCARAPVKSVSLDSLFCSRFGQLVLLILVM